MRIGILTFHHVDNYGATLQAYALWKFLTNQGHDVEIIDYRPYKAVKYYAKGLSPISLKLRFNQHFFDNSLRAWKMRKFLNSKVLLSKKKLYTKAGLKYFQDLYDVVICGSDQIWCTNNFFRGFDSSFFLDFVGERTRKVSYAASFGNTTSLESHREEVSRLVNRFQSVLVRDSNSQNIIFTECNRQAKKVLDPTFLIDYNEISQFPHIKERYLLIYNQAELKTRESDFVRFVAEAEKLLIVSVGRHNEIADKNIANASPEEWLGLFKKASYTVTNTYHGTIFSIIFKRPFITFVNEKKLAKTTDLLNWLSLEKHIFLETTKFDSKDDLLLNVDYGLVSNSLSEKILDSQSYLLQALEQEVVNSKS